MSPFTDEDLKRLKEQADKRWELLANDFINYRDDCVMKMPFLLARLEAAEKCITSEIDDIANYEAWRKAAGKSERQEHGPGSGCKCTACETWG